MNKRRAVVFTLGFAALACATGSLAQSAGKVWRIGILLTNRRTATRGPTVAGFAEQMRKAGYIEGSNLLIEERYAEDQYERLPALASELVGLGVDLILAVSTPAVQAAKQATQTIPIVMINTSDPVSRGIIASLRRPGGNITGPAGTGYDLVDKQLELLHRAAPKARRIAVLTNPDNQDSGRVVKVAQSAARELGLSIIPIGANSTARLTRLSPRWAKHAPRVCSSDPTSCSRPTRH